jgi:tetratricopeptide (TPR) repeat protein
VATQAIKHFGTTQQVAFVHAQMMQELKSKKAKVFSISKTVRYTMAVAASILILFIGARVFEALQLSPQKLYAESFVDFNVSGTRGKEATISEIENSYQKKDYKAVTGAIRSTHLYAKDSLLIGLSYLQTDHLDKAISFFQKLAFSENDFQQDAEYYLSLSYLKDKKYDSALQLMQKIAANPSHLYHAQLSEDVLAKVKKLAGK